MPRSRRLSWRCPRPLISAVIALLALWLLGAAARADTDDGVLTGSFDDDDAADAAAASRDGGVKPGPGGAAAQARAEAQSAVAVSAGAVRFDAILRLVAVGKERQAAAELVQLAHERPADDIAPEALFEAGQLYEDQLAEPEAAQRCYRELVTRYPSSRLLKRAQQHLGHLDSALRTGAAPLIRFQAILRSTKEGSKQRRDQLSALLTESPNFSLADHALFLLADTALRGGDRKAADAWLATLFARFPQSTWTAQGHRLRAESLLLAHQIDAARLHYHALEHFTAAGPLWPLVAREGLETCRQAERWLYFSRGAWLYLGLCALGALVRGRRHLWPPPTELWYYLPVAGLFSLAGLLVQGGALVAPLWQFGLAGTALSWLSASAAQAAAGSSQGRLWRLFSGLVLRALAVLALVFLVIYHHSLIELILETLRNGPEIPD
jgi:TolA-binding protein